MRRITLWLLSTVAALVLLLSYRTSTNSGAGTAIAGATTGGATSTGSGGTPSTGGGTPSSGASSAASSATGSGGTGSGATASGGRTYQGSVAQTRYGPIQVTIAVSNGKITNVSVPTYPDNSGRDQEINSYALPILTQETLTAQSAQIDMVSGATYTSDGYIRSLQAAIDAAHL